LTNSKSKNKRTFDENSQSPEVKRQNSNSAKRKPLLELSDDSKGFFRDEDDEIESQKGIQRIDSD
jgi:hypothetical protein